MILVEHDMEMVMGVSDQVVAWTAATASLGPRKCGSSLVLEAYLGR